jgi:hypothetical protein
MSSVLITEQPIIDLQLPGTDQLTASKEAFLGALRNIGVVSIEADYNGWGDEGQVDSITALRADNSEVNLKRYPCSITGADHIRTLEDLIEEFSWDAVQHFHDGFHNNDGGSGTVTIDVPTGRVKIAHNDNVVESVYSENEF